jgi:hypothetical protein
MPTDAVEANKLISELEAAAGSANVDIYHYDSISYYRPSVSSVIVTCVI